MYGLEELGAARARFAVVAARWALDGPTTARLLGLEGDWAGVPLESIVDAVDRDGEARMRLLCDVDALLSRLVPPTEVVDWLRADGVGYVDEVVTPLEALSSGRPAIRALRRYLEELPVAQPG